MASPMLVRRTVRVRGGRGQALGRALAGLLGLVVAYAGLMVVLLATKSGPDTVDAASGYRSIVDAVGGLTDADATGTLRLAAGIGGLVAFLVLVPLALAQVPRVKVPRGHVDLTTDERGTVTVEPRAVERALEHAAARVDGVSAAAARWETGSATVAVTADRADGLPDRLEQVKGAATDALARHGLPTADVRVLLARFTETPTRRVI
jgi:hypothetical protein